jgi:hypothetical protein
MRLGEWRAASPSREAASQKVNALVDPILDAFGAEPDPSAWVVWGEEPATRYTIFVPTPAGLISCFVRVNVPGEGPRATAKVTRWSRVQLGELAVETQGGHRLLSFQVEQQILRGADEDADRVARFAIELFAAIDGRPAPEAARGGASAARSARKPGVKGATGKALPAPPEHAAGPARTGRSGAPGAGPPPRRG